jgi:hypothetical protein
MGGLSTASSPPYPCPAGNVGGNIDIHFLDGQTIRLNHGVWFVCGKVFDLFG